MDLDFESFVKIAEGEKFKALSFAVADAIRVYIKTYKMGGPVEKKYKIFFETVEKVVGEKRQSKGSDPDNKPNEAYRGLLRRGLAADRFVYACFYWFRFHCTDSRYIEFIYGKILKKGGLPSVFSLWEKQFQASTPTDPAARSFGEGDGALGGSAPFHAPGETQHRGSESDDSRAPLSSPSAPFEWPPYVSEEDARSPDAHESVWLNPFNHFSIPLSHRQSEVARLDAFMQDERPYVICALVAPSGAGKTRLVSEWMRPYVPGGTNTGTDWDAGFVRSRDPADWVTWEIKRNTLIVIDYTYGYEKVMRAITEKCLRHAGPKVRVLVVDHVYPDILHEDFFWGGSFTGQKRVDGHKSRLLFEASPIELKAEKPNSLFIREIIAAAARTETCEFAPTDPRIVAAEKTLDRMAEGAQAGNPEAIRHPLFAALLGQAIRDARIDISNWTRRDLIKQYFDRRTRLPWVKADDNPHAATVGVWVGAYVAIATLLRGVHFAELEENLPSEILSDRSTVPASRVVAQAASRIVSSSDTEILKPFEPDILGETFLILFLEEMIGDKYFMPFFVDMLSGNFTENDKEKYSLNFIETLQRLVRNLLNDNQALPEVKTAWATLSRFLDPARFPPNSLLRYAVSISCSEVIRQDRSLPEEELINGFADHVDVADLQAASEGQLWQQSCIALVHHYDWQASKGRLKEGEADSLFVSLTRLKDKSETDWSALMVAASEGCLDSAKAIHLHFAEDVNASQSDGWTALMTAAHRGQNGVINWLLGLGAQVNLTRIDDGWTALMAACAEGHTETAALLLDNGADVNGSMDTGWTALMVACAGGHAGTAALLLDRGADINWGTTDMGWTALIAACERGHAEVAALLLERGAEVNLGTTDTGRTALMAACHSINYHIVANILDKYPASIEYSAKDRVRRCFISAESIDVKIVRMLISRVDIDINKQDKFGFTALHVAAGRGRADILSVLLERKIDINRTANNGISALMVAAAMGQERIIGILLRQKDIDINILDFDGNSALDHAYHQRHLDIAETLTRSGARRGVEINASRKYNNI